MSQLFNNPSTLVFIGVLITIIGSLIGGYGALRSSMNQSEYQSELRAKADEQARAQRELREKSDEIASLYQRIAESQTELRIKADEQANAQGELRTKSDEIAALNQSIAEAQRGLRAKSDEIAELNRMIAGSVTGGDSFCYIIPITHASQQDCITLLLASKGKYPLYDVKISINDRQHMNEVIIPKLVKGNLPLASVFEAQTGIDIGNLRTDENEARMLREWPLSHPNRLDLAVSINARNGSITELISLRRINDKWISAVQVIRDRDNAIVYEAIDKEFPRDNEGKILWDK